MGTDDSRPKGMPVVADRPSRGYRIARGCFRDRVADPSRGDIACRTGRWVLRDASAEAETKSRAQRAAKQSAAADEDVPGVAHGGTLWRMASPKRVLGHSGDQAVPKGASGAFHPRPHRNQRT